MSTQYRLLPPAAFDVLLKEGWHPPRQAVAEEAFERLCQRLNARSLAQSHPCAGGFIARMALDELRMRGASNIGIIMISSGASPQEVFWKCHANLSAQLCLVINGAAPHDFRGTATRTVWLTLNDLQCLLIDPHPLERLKQVLRSQLHVPQLNPYDIALPVSPNMFFGRTDLLQKLVDEDECSFAIAGPGRIGKSSLLAQYRYKLLKDSDPRRHREHFIDCYPLRNLDPDEASKTIAMSISAGSEAWRVRRHTLLRFLQRQSEEGKEPLELLLDEVDAICGNAAFQEIGEAVRSKFCRVVLCGKVELYRLVRRKDSQFAERLELVLPEPLEIESAERLLREPLTDLGFTLKGFETLLDQVLVLTGRKPHLIQATGKRLIEAAVKRGCSEISPVLFAELREELVDRFYGTFPVEDLRDDMTRCVAILLLQAGGQIETRGGERISSSSAFTRRTEQRRVTLSYLQDLANHKGISLAADKALEICEDLWISNTLIREHGNFFLANPYLSTLIRHLDFNGEIQRLVRAIRSPAPLLFRSH